MGFYGNITNTARTQFQFDKIYPSRTAMENQCSKDGVYVGRYVLIEYDSPVQSNYKTAFRQGTVAEFLDGSYLYMSKNFEEANRVPYFADQYWDYDWDSTDIIDGVVEGTRVRVKETEDQYIEQTLVAKVGEYTFYECIGASGQAEGHAAKFKYIATDYTDNYSTNYNRDKAAYSNSIGRGWDSTVWQKVYEDGKEKYVMIAELNSVVPTFDIQADAPSLAPITPHFDANSTNVYYKLHWQPQWGLRTRAASGEVKSPVLDKNGATIRTKNPVFASAPHQNTETGSETYPSNVSTIWRKYEYDTLAGNQNVYQFNINTETWETPNEGTENEERYQIPAAIYFNQEGFDPTVISHTAIIKDKIKNAKWDGVSDVIRIEPTGWSGHQYSPHSGFQEVEPQVDTQELVMMLPSLGNTISEIWDLVYGGPSTNSTISKTMRRNKNIGWEDPEEPYDYSGLRLITEKYYAVSITADTFEPDVYYYKDKDTDRYMLAQEYKAGQAYYSRSSGYSYTPAETETIAGCINTVHDLIGMIITDRKVTDDPTSPDIDFEQISSNHIYYYPSDGTYRIKDIDYEFEPLEDLAYTYSPVDVTPENFVPYLYFIKEITYKLAATYTEGETYFQKNGEAYNEINITQNNFITNTYYTKQEKFIPADEFIEGTQYYTKELNIAENAIFTLANDAMKDFEEGYYKAPTGSFIYQRGGYPEDGMMYYSIDESKLGMPITFKDNYLPNVFYYKVPAQGDASISEYYLSTDEQCNRLNAPFYKIPQEPGERLHKATIELNYPNNYDIQQEEAPDDPVAADNWKGPYYSTEGFWDEANKEWSTDTRTELKYFFVPGVFYKKVEEAIEGEEEVKISWKALDFYPSGGEDPGYGYLLDRPRVNTSLPDDLPEYGDPVNAYRVKLIDIEDELLNQGKVYYLAFTQKYTTEEEIDGIVQEVEKVRYTQFSEIKGHKGLDYIHHQTGRLGCREMGIDGPTNLVLPIEVYEMDPGEEYDLLYEAERFFYKGNEGSYIKDRLSTFTEERRYYYAEKFIVTENGAVTPFDNSIFYAPNKYYYFSDEEGKFVIETSPTLREGVTYYIREDIYISNDSSNTLPLGSTWNLNATFIPNSVVLSKRREKPIMRELSGFGRGLNTINGLILKMSELLAANNYQTRDRNTLQGAINYLNDIIFKLDALTPGQFPVVDHFGRLHGANTKFDDWVSIHIDPNIEQPIFEIRHDYNPTTLEDDADDLNETAERSTFTMPIFTFDEKGHKVAEAVKEFTLPYNFKHVSGKNNSTSVLEAVSSVNTKITAKNAQDEITFEGSNKWIAIDTATEDTLKIGHVLSGVTKAAYGLAQNETLETLKTNKVFEVPYFNVDEAGHIISASTKTVELPAVFNTITVGEISAAATNANGHEAGSTSATVVEDTFTFHPGNKWINLAINKPNAKALTISHVLSPLSASSYGDNTNRTPKFGDTFNTLYLTTDEAGHLTGLNTYTVKIPGLNLSKESDATKNVLVGVDYTYDATNANGTFKEVKTVLSALTLNSYTIASKAEPILATDTLGTALGKLEKTLSILNSGADQEGSLDYKLEAVKTELRGSGIKEDFNTMSKIQSWISEGVAGESSIINRVKALEDDKLPSYEHLDDDNFYLIQMVEGKPEWVSLAHWNGGKY